MGGGLLWVSSELGSDLVGRHPGESVSGVSMFRSSFLGSSESPDLLISCLKGGGLAASILEAKWEGYMVRRSGSQHPNVNTGD